MPRSIARARVVCTLTEAMRDEIAAEYGLEPDRIHVTYPGVDPAWFDVAPLTADDRRRLGLPSRYLLAVGTLEPRKNLAQLLRAYGRLRASDPQTPPIVLAGASGWGPSLDLDGLPPQAVVKTGYLDTADLRSVVAGASCLAFPSIYEGFGLPPVEALACGVPVVATDLPVTREVLGDAARLVPTGDVDALAEALRIELNAPAPDRATVAARRGPGPALDLVAVRRADAGRLSGRAGRAERGSAAQRRAVGGERRGKRVAPGRQRRQAGREPGRVRQHRIGRARRRTGERRRLSSAAPGRGRRRAHRRSPARSRTTSCRRCSCSDRCRPPRLIGRARSGRGRGRPTRSAIRAGHRRRSPCRVRVRGGPSS